MLIIRPRLLFWDEIVRVACLLVWAFTILAFFGIIVLFVGKNGVQATSKGTSVHSSTSWSLPAIARGILTLDLSCMKGAAELQNMLVLWARNTRPDASLKVPQALIGLKDSSLMRALAGGERLYLHWEPQFYASRQSNGPPAPVAFSEGPTCLSIAPVVVSDRDGSFDLLFDASLGGSDEDSRSAGFFLEVSQMQNPLSRDFIHAPWMKSLREARFWTGDAFLTLYGGNEYREDSKMCKIEMGRQVLSAHIGNFLVYQGSEWKKGSLTEAKGMPLARVGEIKEGQLEVEVWDPSGFYREQIRLLPLGSPPPVSKMEAVFLSPRMRSSSQVSCVLGKRRVVLKAGDWWFKGSAGWRSLKKQQEIEDFLSYRLLGELFVVDGLDKVQGKSVLKGHLFNHTRKETVVVSLPVAEGRVSSPLPTNAKFSPPPVQNRVSSSASAMPVRQRSPEGL